ncbi:unnamed protein product [Prorocentrum cordatum]|uniref:Uncharacterized protein n=1 Tax=Prorocentrum cordatum TaxID=2364126 RepID=A0ABN9S6Q2_9DINO|nr:unnamed protein product [Polarella glacialis]
MVRHGFFMDVEDGASATHGPLSVVNFDLEVPDEEVARVSTGQLAASQPSAQQKAAAVAAISTGVMGSALVAVWVARSLVLVRRRQHEWRGIPDGSPNRDAEE